MDKPQSGFFKKCSMCGFEWRERLSFLSDPTLRIIGYQSDFDQLMAGLFLFTHSCGTSLSIPAEHFEDLSRGPIFIERLNGTETCPGYCLHKDDLRPCQAKCQCAYVREIVQVILDWPKPVKVEN